MNSLNDLRNFLEFAEGLAVKAGSLLLKEQTKVKIVKHKDRKDIATSADLASEKLVIDSILKAFPDHGLISEEKGEINKPANFLWYIDPLDGTKEYIRGIPLWNFSMALEYKNETVVSVVYRPQEGSLFSAQRDSGSFLNGRRIKTSETDNLEDSFVYCYLPSYHRDKNRYGKAFKKLAELGKRVYRLRSLSDENTALSWLAQGGIEAYVNLSNKPKWHDIAPGILIAKEAGAEICDLRGNVFRKGVFNGIVASNNKRIRAKLLELLK